MIEDIYLVKEDGLELLTGGMPQDMWVVKRCGRERTPGLSVAAGEAA